MYQLACRVIPAAPNVAGPQRQIAPDRVRPELAQIPHARIGPPASYARVLRCEFRFEAPVATLRIQAAQLPRPLPEQNPMLQELAKSYREQHFGMPTQQFIDGVRKSKLVDLLARPQGVALSQIALMLG